MLAGRLIRGHAPTLRLLARVPLAVLLGLAGFSIWGGVTRGHNWGDDFAQYIMQAKSIVEGRPQAFIDANRFTVEQSSMPDTPVAYPWGFPLLLAPLYAAFGLELVALKAVNLVCFLLFIAVLWVSFHKHHSPLGRVAGVSLFAVNPRMLRANDDILSDIPFLLLSTVCVVLIGFVIVDRRRLISTTWDQLLLGAALASAFLVRSNGILLLVTLVISQAVGAILRASSHRAAGAATPRPPRTGYAALRSDFALLPYVSFALITLAWTTILPDGGSSYVDHLRRVRLADILRHVHYYVDLPSAFFDSVPHHQIVYGATIPLALTGASRRMRSDYHILVYITLTVGLYLIWPDTEGLRFLFPILPFYVSFVLGSLDHPGERFTSTAKARWRKAIWIVPVVIVLVYFVRASTRNVVDNLSRNRASLSGPFVNTSQEMLAFITAHTPVDSTIIFFKPRAMRLLTGRRSILITRVDQLGRGDHLCYYRDGSSDLQLTRSDLDRVVATGNFQLIYANEDFEVYRLTGSRREGQGVAGGEK
jgi:hypothetical protein